MHFPTTLKEVKKLKWDSIDIIIFTGDAFIDHPSFGTAVIARVLESKGYKVAIIPQPNWQDDLRDFKKLGKPNLFFAVSAGNMDSMVNHYTANKRLRSDDAFTPGGKAGFRPDYASVVYSNILKKIYPDTPVVIGGIEASMRRFTHYDYWQNKLLPSILINSKADVLCYGMAEKSIIKLAETINETGYLYEIENIKQIAYISDINDNKDDDIELHSHEDCLSSKRKFSDNFIRIEKEYAKYKSEKRITQVVEGKKIIVNPPNFLAEDNIDEYFDLPYTREPHPKYKNKEDIPAYNMIQNSVNIHRGCFGACSFCAINMHQGKFIKSRSFKSILGELKNIAEKQNFKVHINDLGGPSANMYGMTCFNIELCEKCNRVSCIFPKICKNLNTSHKKLVELYSNAKNIKGINKLSIGSGIRYDLCLHNTDNPETNAINKTYLENLIVNHVSGRLKVAPEHNSDYVLKQMRKTPYSGFKQLHKIFKNITKNHNLDYKLVPYFIAAHPGCTKDDMQNLASELKLDGFKLEQVQTFTPTPMTLASVMYYTGYNPYTNERVYVERDMKKREQQVNYLLWYKKENITASKKNKKKRKK